MVRKRVPQNRLEECQNELESSILMDISRIPVLRKNKFRKYLTDIYLSDHERKYVKYQMSCTGLDKQGKLGFLILR